LGLNNSQHQAIIREYEQRQNACREESASRYMEVCNKLPDYPLIEKEIATLSVESGKKLLHGDKDVLVKYNKELDFLIMKKNNLLKTGGFPDYYLDPIYVCNDCRDTGYIDHQKCHCFKNATINLLYKQSNLEEVLQKENFSTFSYDYYSKETIDTKSNLSARELVEDAVFGCKNFIHQFNKSFQNIYIYGNVGIGKTFLLNCIAKELLQREHSVLYFTATDLLNILITSAFNKNDLDSNNLRELIYSCECLIVDDLGTEITNSAVDTQLFICINERLQSKKPVIISSNLSLNHIRERYDERIASRISGNYQIIKIIGEDIRVQKKRMLHSDCHNETDS